MSKATIKTSQGDMVVEFFDADAPNTVANFRKLAGKGFYNGIKFHRVIPDFVVQGGCPHTKDAKGPVGTGGPGWRIKCETAGNPHKHKVGALSMAHAGKDTGGSQFFIVLSEPNTRHLNGVHTVFGQVTQGLELLPSIAQNDHMVSVRVADAE
jgi:peptidyl-prolyl cis-trans isomerase B (cyclophilin B)